MNIQALGTLDFEAVRALTLISFYKHRTPKKRMLWSCILFGLLIALIIVEMFLFGFNSTLLILLCLTLLMLGLRFFLYFVLPKKQYEAMGNMQNAVNHYVFDDETITVKTVTDQYNGEAIINYSALVKAYETQKYIFFYQIDNSAYVVDKSSVSGGSADELKAKLVSFIGDKYCICKY